MWTIQVCRRCLFGQNELKGKSYYDLYKDYPVVVEMTRRTLGEAKISHFSGWFHRRYLRGELYPLRKYGRIVGAAGFVVDDTEKELGRLESEVQRQILDQIFVGVVDGIAAGLVLTYNITSGIGRAAGAMTLVAREGVVDFDIPPADMNRGDEVGDLARAFDGILHEFRNVEHLAKELATGNWRATVKVRGDKDAMNLNLASMLDQVNEALKEINEGVRQVSTGAGEVSSASQTLSSGAQESAASLEEITASMSEINSQTSANAQSAAEARDLVQQTSAAAGAGQQAMQEMNAAMDRIGQNRIVQGCR